jgi:hypothetical protein
MRSGFRPGASALGALALVTTLVAASTAATAAPLGPVTPPTAGLPAAGLPAAGLPAAGGAADATAGRRAAPSATVNGWRQLSTVESSSIAEPHAVQNGAGAIVIWPQEDSLSSDSIRARTISATGQPGGSIAPVVTGWDAVTNDPKIITTPGGFMTVFSGIRSTTPGEPYDGPMAYAVSPNPSSWSLGPGSLSQSTVAYASNGTGAVDDGGTPVVGFNGGSTDRVTLHRGIDAAVPAGSPDWTSSPIGLCCSYYANLARDRESGAIWTAWYSNASGAANAGVFTQRVWPLPLGARTKAPDSSEGASASDPDQTIAMAGRIGGEVWAAYLVGYAPAEQIALWRLGSNERLIIRANDPDAPSLAAAPGGRLWLSWYDRGSKTVKAVRTNRAVTRFGRVQTFPIPGGSDGAVWTTTGVGGGGPLDLVVNAQRGFGDSHIWHRRVLPGLTVDVRPARIDRGRVTIEVSDAGEAVAGARVRLLGDTVTTNARGEATVTVARSTRDGRYKVTATKAGYAPGSDTLRVV